MRGGTGRRRNYRFRALYTLWRNGRHGTHTSKLQQLQLQGLGKVNAIITTACRALDPENGRVSLTFNNIMYHTNILSLPQKYKKQITAFILEFKRDIYVRRTERCTGVNGGRWAGRTYTDQRIDIHILMACDSVIQMTKYRGKTATLLEQIRLLSHNNEDIHE
jgi:hypothetical protein